MSRRARRAGRVWSSWAARFERAASALTVSYATVRTAPTPADDEYVVLAFGPASLRPPGSLLSRSHFDRTATGAATEATAIVPRPVGPPIIAARYIAGGSWLPALVLGPVGALCTKRHRLWLCYRLEGSDPHTTATRLTLDLRFGVHCGQCYIHCTPFSDCNMMLEFEVGDGTRWQGQMVVVAVVKLLDGTRVEVVYVKWLSLPISGLDRQVLPLPSHFNMYQWAYTDVMGTRRRGGQSAEINFSIMPTSSIVRAVPIAYIGEFPSAVNQSLLREVKKILRHRASSSVHLDRLPLVDLIAHAQQLGLSAADVSGNVRCAEARPANIRSFCPPCTVLTNQ